MKLQTASVVLVLFLSPLLIFPFLPERQPYWFTMPTMAISKFRSQNSDVQKEIVQQAVPVSIPIDWSQIAIQVTAMLSSLAVVGTAVSKLIVEPMLDRKIAEFMAAARDEFPSGDEFTAHDRADSDFQNRTDRELDWIRNRITERK